MRKTLVRLALMWLCLAAAVSSCAAPAPTPSAIPTPQPSATAFVAAAPIAAAPIAPALPGPTTVLDPEILSAGDPYAPELGNKGYDVQRYILRLALDPRVVRLDANVTVEAVSTFDRLQQVALDFVGFEITQVTAGKLPASFFRLDNKLIVNLPQPLSPGAAFTLNIGYRGTPVQRLSDYVPFVPSLGLFFRQDNAYVVSEPDGARFWFPCNDHPRDKATYRFEIDVPDGYVGVANGKLISTLKGVATAFPGGKPGDRYIWEHAFPMATYLATVAVGKYVRVESTSPKGIPLRSYVFPEERNIFEQHTVDFGRALDWMSDTFGPYPFEEFGYVMVKQLNTSLETQTMVVLDSNAGTGTMTHELAHMWFGDWVTPDTWREVWLNEGFATYATAWYGARNSPARLDQSIAASMNSQRTVTYGLINPPRSELFGSLNYNKGAALLNALRKEMGDQAFVEGLRMYVKQYGGRTATGEEFEVSMEQAAGKSLQGLFADWLN